MLKNKEYLLFSTINALELFVPFITRIGQSYIKMYLSLSQLPYHVTQPLLMKHHFPLYSYFQNFYFPYQTATSLRKRYTLSLVDLTEPSLLFLPKYVFSYESTLQNKIISQISMQCLFHMIKRVPMILESCQLFKTNLFLIKSSPTILKVEIQRKSSLKINFFKNPLEEEILSFCEFG